MRRKEIDQKLNRLLNGALPDDQAAELRRKILSARGGQDEFELYRRLELELERLSENGGTTDSGDTASFNITPAKDSKAGAVTDKDTHAGLDWDTRRDAVRTAMERDALLGLSSPPVARRIFRISMALSLAAVLVVTLPMTLKWLISRTPLPVGSSISVYWPTPKQPPASGVTTTENTTGSNTPALVTEARALKIRYARPDRAITVNVDCQWQNAITNTATPATPGTPTSSGVIVILTPRQSRADLGESLF